MCRGFQQNERDHHHHHHHHLLLNIKAFYIRLSTNSISPNPGLPLPDSLTLYYLPRINGSPLEINRSKIRPHSPAFVTLHRVVSPPTATSIIAANNNNKGGGSIYFGSRERVKAGQGARFEVYLREHKVLKGIFRKDWDGDWKMECSCGLAEDGVLQQVQEVVKEAEVCVAAEGLDVAMREKVEMAVEKRKRRRSARCFQGTILEEIPEDTECELNGDSCCCCCCCCSSSDEEEMIEMGSSHSKEEETTTADIEMEGVGWAVDVGIWVMCLGVGFLVSKAAASNNFLRRTRTRTRTRTPFF